MKKKILLKVLKYFRHLNRFLDYENSLAQIFKRDFVLLLIQSIVSLISSFDTPCRETFWSKTIKKCVEKSRNRYTL